MVVELAASRIFPAGVARTFDVVLSVPLPYLFEHRYAAIPPVKAVRDEPPAWGEVGQSRTIVLGDGGTILETITEVDRPNAFGYELTDISGPMKPLAASIDGRFAFEHAGTGVRVTWSWRIHPRGRLGSTAMPLFARMWRPYARTALDRLEAVLVD
jgi:hypothetical protein